MIKVAELFAGVGGFRLGLEGWNGLSSLSGYKKPKKPNFEVVWSNQWEPSTNIQHASTIYESRWGIKGHSNQDITKIKISDIPNHDLLVGGFPCQDYSVAKVASQATGIIGKKGVLWWEIHKVISKKGADKPSYLLLENVDRLLVSPSNQRGRDFAIMLASLSDLGYAVEWRVINAADYGMPQRRRRIFFLAYHETSPLFQMIKMDPIKWLETEGVIANAFPALRDQFELAFPIPIKGNLVEITDTFNIGRLESPFRNSGIMVDREFWTYKSSPGYNGPFASLGDVVTPLKYVPEDFFLDNNDIDKWKYLKGPKKEERKRSDGSIFYYNEGGLEFPDPLDKPSRTIITSEGGRGPSRFKHVINQNGKLRRLTPVELERLNMFPDNHTQGVSDIKRAFFMGNALVVGVVENLGNELAKKIQS